MKIIKVVIPQRMKGERLDSALSELLPNISRSKIAFYIKSGDGLINDQSFKPNDKACGDEIVNLSINQKKNNNWLAEKIPLDIIFEDEYLIVINKPFGMVTHPGAGNWNGTLANALLDYDDNLSKLDRAGIVHRIDKNTSGLVVIAKNNQAHENLSIQFSKHSILRVYQLLIWGKIRPSKGKIETFITRSSKNRQIMEVSKTKGKKAITNYDTIEIFENKNTPTLSLLECKLETGRTHQIRVHMNYLGNSIVGDDKYKKKFKKIKNINPLLEKNIVNLNRQFLHASTIGFFHPKKRKEMIFNSILPQELEIILKMLRNTDK